MIAKYKTKTTVQISRTGNSEMTSDGWNIRNVRYEHIHNVQESDMNLLAESLELSDTNTVADVMCGYGAVTKALFTWCGEGIKISAILVDCHSEQLDRSISELENNEHVTRLIGDARHTLFDPNSLDRAVIKMGIHEVPKVDQQLIVDNMFKALKPGGIFVTWDVAVDCEEVQILFQKIIREKDRLAGFDSLVKDRYFFTKEELVSYFKIAGFHSVECVKDISYRFSSKERLDSEFRNDIKILEKFNEYIRHVVPEHLRSFVHYEDVKDTIYMTFNKAIVKGRKG